MHVHIPNELHSLIWSYACPFTLRQVNKKMRKLFTEDAKRVYPLGFGDIEYLKAMKIRPTLTALRYYWTNPQNIQQRRIENSFHQCNGFTKKGHRCKNKCKIYPNMIHYDYVYCNVHEHWRTLWEGNLSPGLIHYRKSKMFKYLTNGLQ